MPTNRSIVFGSQVTHIGNGGALAAGAMSAASDVSTALDSTNLLRYDRADVALKISNTASVSSLSNTVLLYRRDLDIDGTNDEPAPSTVSSLAYRNHLVGTAQSPAYTAASVWYYNLTDVPVTEKCELYLENTMNVGIGAGWTAKVTPKTDSYA